MVLIVLLLKKSSLLYKFTYFICISGFQGEVTLSNQRKLPR